ncbi:MAG: hypothetical protein MK132_16035 [Lentisphaerales bacterium]|nr:hypothetical protein [Lentisphaerales bacterium]
MKSLITCLLLISSLAFSQEDSMRTFANADYKVQAYLVPEKENHFTAKEGTRVRIIVNLKNDGKSRFILKQQGFITASLMVKAREIDFPLYLEQFSQEDMLKTRLKTLERRIENITGMEDDKALSYAKQHFPEDQITNKVDLLKKLSDQVALLKGKEKNALTFDKNKAVDPGSNLYFSASGKLPAGNDKPEDYCDLTVKIVNSNNKHISIPVTALFY